MARRGCHLRLHRETIQYCNELLAQRRLPEAIDDMTDWGDATPNETGRPPTWTQPPAEPESRRSAPDRLAAGYGYPPSVPLWRHDKGERIIPPPTEGSEPCQG